MADSIAKQFGFPDAETMLSDDHALESAQLAKEVIGQFPFVKHPNHGWVFTTQPIEDTFVLRPITDERGFEIPTDSDEPTAYNIQPGDKYVLLDILLPESYIDAAEELLYEKGLEYLNKHKHPRYQFDVEVDQMWAASLPGADQKFFLGQGVGIIDNELGFSYQSKIIKIERDLLNKQKYKLVFSEDGTNYSRLPGRRAGNIPHIEHIPNVILDGSAVPRVKYDGQAGPERGEFAIANKPKPAKRVTQH